MATLFLLEQGAKLGKTSKRLIIEKNREILSEIPEFKVDRVFIFGNVQVTTQALRFLLENKIDLSFFTLTGKLLGKLVSAESKNIFIRKSQYDAYSNYQFRLEIAKHIVSGKLKNYVILLQKHKRNHPDMDLTDEISGLSEMILKIKSKTQLSSLMGIEGTGTKIYFKGFSKMIKKEFSFDNRNRRPPVDPVNSLLSLGYSILTSEMFSITQAMGLEPYLGYFHTIDYGRPSLALDLIEEFRPVIIDRMILDLINRNVLKKEDFDYEYTEDGERVLRVLLNKEARRVFFSAYEKKMNTQVIIENEKMTYRKLMNRQVRKMMECIGKGDSNYEPFILK